MISQGTEINSRSPVQEDGTINLISCPNFIPDAATVTAKPEFGCKHYRRRCKIRAPCCNEVFGCRHFHNEILMEKPNDRHKIPRREIARVIYLLCHTEQPVAQVCTNCGVTMGEYFCGECKFFDDDTGKGKYHCDECGICKVGGKNKFFHCQKCGIRIYACLAVFRSSLDRPNIWSR